MAILKILALWATSVAMGLSLAHALELPGKLRLDRQDYFTAQKIFYPGFTWGGASEPLAALLLLALAVLAPIGGLAFWLWLAAAIAMILVQLVYWFVTQPVNRHWMKDVDLTGAGKMFFQTGPAADPGADWTGLRDRWEYSHVTRAILSTLSLLLALAALVMGDPA